MREAIQGTIGVLLMLAGAAHAVEGLNRLQSSYTVAETVDRLERQLTKAGFRIFARIDHGAGAKGIDMALPPSELLLFGNPKVGTRLMQSQASVGIELPLKFLVWEDAAGVVNLGWNDPGWITGRHGITDRAQVVEKMRGVISKFASEVAEP